VVDPLISRVHLVVSLPWPPMAIPFATAAATTTTTTTNTTCTATTASTMSRSNIMAMVRSTASSARSSMEGRGALPLCLPLKRTTARTSARVPSAEACLPWLCQLTTTQEKPRTSFHRRPARSNYHPTA
jgi:hypothetical protein